MRVASMAEVKNWEGKSVTFPLSDLLPLTHHWRVGDRLQQSAQPPGTEMKDISMCAIMCMALYQLHMAAPVSVFSMMQASPHCLCCSSQDYLQAWVAAVLEGQRCNHGDLLPQMSLPLFPLLCLQMSVCEGMRGPFDPRVGSQTTFSRGFMMVEHMLVAWGFPCGISWWPSQLHCRGAM